MKLTIVLLIAAIMQVSASSLAQKISLTGKDLSLAKVFKEIRKQTGYNVFYPVTAINPNDKINVAFKNASLDEVMKRCLEGKSLTYGIERQTIVIKEKEPSFLDKVKDYFAVIDARGQVLNENGSPLVGATVRIKNATRSVITGVDGSFYLRSVDDKAVLVIAYVGYITKEMAVKADLGVITMEVSSAKLEEVVVNTGYQTFAKERATGSFEKIDNQLFNRITSTDVFTRLNGTVPGIFFNTRGAVLDRGTTPAQAMTIRGLSTLNDAAPLVVVDNIPYEGSLINLNPNDVQDITILKDAAAASIWGTRAGNGVVVITTKKGQYDNPLSISLNSNVSIYEKPDLFSLQEMSSSDFIDVEKFLFDKGKYTNDLSVTSPYPLFFTPVVEILDRKSKKLISGDEANAQIDALRNYDVRNDYLKYVYRNQVNQQYALNLNGGGKQINYIISGGFDRNLNSLVTSSNSRNTIRSIINLKPFNGMEIQTGIQYVRARYQDEAGTAGFRQGNLRAVYPYARLADENGNPLVVGFTYRSVYLDELAKNPNLLDWRYRPIEDMYKNISYLKTQNILFNLGLNYRLTEVVSASFKYQYEDNGSDQSTLNKADSYIVRNYINLFTNPSTFNRSIPLGSRYANAVHSNTSVQNLRGQFNVNKNWNNKHEIAAVAGGEIRKNSSLSTRLGDIFGYNEVTGSFPLLDYITANKPQYYGGQAAIPASGPSIGGSDYRNTSVFANASYTYNSRYILSGSIRKDASNIFGDNANKKGRPLWSAGLGWNLSDESFFKNSAIPYLKLRATYGHSGNIVPGIPAYAVVTYGTPNTITNLQTASSSNLPNPDLRWEKVTQMNTGVDFRLKNNILSGSLEYYHKISKDVISKIPIDQILGFDTQTLNATELEGKGIDLSLNSVNVANKTLNWNTNFIFSYTKTLVRKYLIKRNPLNESNNLNPIEGNEVYGVYAYKWSGLDPLTGDPQGYYNGQVTKVYTDIFKTDLKDYHYFGPAIPRFFGSLRNTLEFRGFSLSANIFYKFKYYVKWPGISYTNLFAGNPGNREFTQRWQKPGDEKITNVPSMVYPVNTDRDNFYNNSEAVIEKGDHIRLQDITGAYTFKNLKGLKNVKLYGNLSNIGILWRANKKGMDPDIISGYRIPRIIAFGLTADY